MRGQTARYWRVGAARGKKGAGCPARYRITRLENGRGRKEVRGLRLPVLSHRRLGWTRRTHKDKGPGASRGKPTGGVGEEVKGRAERAGI